MTEFAILPEKQILIHDRDNQIVAKQSELFALQRQLFVDVDADEESLEADTALTSKLVAGICAPSRNEYP